MNLQDQEMLNELIVESREHLSGIEPDLLELEQNGDAISPELINRVFRAMHSIKGGFGFFGIEHITKLSHAMENVMAKIRDKNLTISPEVTDALLKGVDKLRALLDDVAGADSLSIESEIAGLNPFLDQKTTTVQKAGETKDAVQEQRLDSSFRQKHPDITDQHLTEAVRHGKILYELTVNSRSDLAANNLTPAVLLEGWEKFGDIIDVAIDFSSIQGIAGSADKELVFFVVFSTVLEPDLISEATGIPTEQIFTVDLSEAKHRVKNDVGARTAEAAQAVARSAASGDAGGGGAIKPSQKQESKIEEALRVKVSLLNNLMNLAGELVLSRNQLMQSMNRKLSDAVDMQTLFKSVDSQLLLPCKAALDKAVGPDDTVNRCAVDEHTKRLGEFAKSISLHLIDIPGMANIIQNIDMVTSLLQESIMQTRLQPISVVFSKFPRLIRDLAKKLNKEINLTLVGQDVELDKSIVEQLSDPLTHLIRNSVDHGIETLEERKKAGKNATGEVVLHAFHEGGKVHIQIRDDGAGINRERVRQKAIEKNLYTDENLAKMTDREIDGIILLPGFSTAKVVSDISGRGVGMDVVKTNIERLGGTVDIDSVPGKGTTITMKLPLTLAIISSLVVSAGGRRFAIPQVGIEELVRIRAQDVTKRIDRLKECEVMRLRGKLLPLVRLDNVLCMHPMFVHPETKDRSADNRKRWSDRRGIKDGRGMAPFNGETRQEPVERRGIGLNRRTHTANALKIVVLKYGEHRYGLVVENVFDSEEIVVKPLSGFLKSAQCYAGSTIMGDGAVAMILDTNGIAVLANLKFGDLAKDIEQEKARFLKENSKIFREFLLFNTGGTEDFGVDLGMVARVEKVETDRIAAIGGKEFLKYDNYSMRLLRLSDYLPVSPGEKTNGHTFVIVPKGVKHLMGIIADQVKDVVKTDANLDTTNIRGTGIKGSVMINSSLTMVIDVESIFKAAEPELYA
jgi:two-component system chemotaxis sensor kinase CheA